MEKKQLKDIPIGSIVQHLKDTKTYEVLNGFRLKKTDDGVEYNGGSLIEFYIVKENNMKIYKKNDTVEFTIGTETFIGEVLNDHITIIEHSNHIVFDKLGIKDHDEFCSKHYGYRADEGGWPECKSGDYEALSRLIHALQELCDKHNSSQTYSWKLYTPEPTQEIKVGDWVKCVNHSNRWSEKFTLGERYEVLHVDNSDYHLPNIQHGGPLWVPKQDFVLCNDEVQDDSEWKVGDKIQYVQKGRYDLGLNDCTVGNIYTIIGRSTLKNIVIIDDVGDEVCLIKEERDCFKKIINNQTTQLNYHDKEFRSNSIELSGSHYAISNTTRVGGCSISSSKSKIRISS